MQKFLLGTAALVALFSAIPERHASAADVEIVPEARPPLEYRRPVLVPWTWSGFYLGFNLGYSTGSLDTNGTYETAGSLNPLFTTSSSQQLQGTIFGGQVGYNLQVANWLLGLEADLQYAGQRVTLASVCPSASCNPAIVGVNAPVTAELEHRFDWFGTIRPRLGMAVTPDILPYVTGGLAFAYIRTSGTLRDFGLSTVANTTIDNAGNPIVTTTNVVTPLSTVFSASATKPGIALGAGVEVHLSGRLSGKAEYLYTDFGTVSATVTNLQNSTPITFVASSRVTNHILRLGLNYKLTPPRVVETPDGPAIEPDVFTAPPAFSTAVGYDWSGAYVGINAGGGWGRSDWASTPDNSSGSATASGGVIGGTLGYNVQTASAFVLGEEVDLARTSFKATIPAASCAPNCELTNDWLATARLRFGYSFEWFMPYVTAGVSIGRLLADIAGTPLGTQSKNNLSWTVGLGAEFVITGPWTAKLEYLHVDLSGMNCDVSCAGGPIAMNLNENIVRAGLNYRMWTR